MIQEQTTMITHWALVIGVNHYSNPEEHLKGAVNDANLVKEYLEISVPTNLNIVSLTASSPSIIRGPPCEPPNIWPTCNNTLSQLEQIIKNANSGDRVFMYFAGHGAHIPKSSTHALVLLSRDGCEKEYLRINSIYKRVDEMIDKGLNVTLILDCCFSGAIVRGDDEQINIRVRSLDYDLNVPIYRAQELASTNIEASDNTRSAVMQRSWNEYARGFMVLCACAPDERAYEIQLHGKSQGLFTHYLIHALNLLFKSGLSLTHFAVHEQISTSLHAHWSRQTPMRYGKTDHMLFGESLLVPEGKFFSAYRDDNGSLLLRAGELHGIAKGDEFHASPVEQERATSAQSTRSIANMRVTGVRSVESDLEEIDGHFEGPKVRKWEMKPLTSLTSDVILVGLPSGYKEEIESMCREPLRYVRLVDRQATTPNQVQESCSYNVMINAQDQIEIVNPLMEKIQSIPPIHRDSKAVPHQLERVLRHIAEFKYFESLENRIPNPGFQSSYSIKCSHSREHSNRFEIQHEEVVTFTLENKGKDQLYVGVFNFRPSWSMIGLTAKRGFIVLPMNGAKKVRLKMVVPQLLQDDKQTRCEDHIKFLITNTATHFQWCLPDIVDTINGVNEIHRGENINLYASLAGLIDKFRGQEESVWATQSFLIRTHMT
ncbi:hypothetical protein OPT61_g5356 [Boeremia exigua]|uniref:Uncharacterized protein n=1 Tax=Boeremia exigua TaxID=749465 RepID=A0ACC2IAS6_9PLEO|nr:hypothetical protein OPT61_g5356 [Boeremia exigua]